MPSPYRVAVIVGSLRKGSFTRRTAKALIGLAPASLDCHFVEIGDLPLYDEDLEAGGAPAAWVRFRDEVGAAQAVLFATPEYNRSVPGALKNAIDVGSRPYGHSVWKGKPAAVVSTSPGALGGFGANHHLRQSLVFLDMPVMQQPEAYLGQVAHMVAEDFTIPDEKTRGFLTGLMQAFADWIALTLAKPA